MKPRRFPAETGLYALQGGTEDNYLPVERALVDTPDGGSFPVIRSVWELTDEERQAIADGGNISLVVYGRSHPPVSIYVTDEEIGRARDSSDGDEERGEAVPPGDDPGAS